MIGRVVYLTIIVFAFCLAQSVFAEMVSTNYRVSSVVLSSGGIPMSADTYHINATSGPPSPIGNQSSTNYSLYPGFWPTVLDNDGDGLTDYTEISVGCSNPYDADTDNDGISDGVEDANHDGQKDPLETDPCNADTDNDFIQDGTELGYTLNDIDPDTDGSFQPDLDPSTTTDPLDDDTDNDGLKDGEEDTNYNGKYEPEFGETDPGFNSSAGIPTISEWGLIIFSFLLLTAGMIVLRIRQEQRPKSG